MPKILNKLNEPGTAPCASGRGPSPHQVGHVDARQWLVLPKQLLESMAEERLAEGAIAMKLRPDMLLVRLCWYVVFIFLITIV